MTREGMIPTILGTAVAATGLALKGRNPSWGWGIAGFGLAHVILGAMDLADQHRKIDI